MADLGKRLQKNNMTLLSSEIFAVEATQQVRNLKVWDLMLLSKHLRIYPKKLYSQRTRVNHLFFWFDRNMMHESS